MKKDRNTNIPYCEWLERINEVKRPLPSKVLHGHARESRKGKGIETDIDASICIQNKYKRIQSQLITLRNKAFLCIDRTAKEHKGGFKASNILYVSVKEHKHSQSMEGILTMI